MTNLSEHGLVDLVLDDERRRAARVTALGRRHILLALFPAPPEMCVGPDFTSATLERVDEGGISRVAGAVASIAFIDRRQSVTFKPADPSALRQRRSAPRIALAREVLLSRGGGSAPAVVGRVLDVSSSGMRLRSAASFAVGERVVVTVDSRGTRSPAGLEGRVARVGLDGDCALVFAHGPDVRRRWVERLIRSARVC